MVDFTHFIKAVWAEDRAKARAEAVWSEARANADAGAVWEDARTRTKAQADAEEEAEAEAVWANVQTVGICATWDVEMAGAGAAMRCYPDSVITDITVIGRR